MYVVVTFLDVLDNFSIAQGDVVQTHNLGSLNTHTCHSQTGQLDDIVLYIEQ